MFKQLKDKIIANSDDNIDIDSFSLEAASKKREGERYHQDTAQRKWLSIWTAFVVSIWLLLVILILCFNTFFNLNLSDTVLSVLLSTTTLNILGLSLIVLRGLFGNKE